MNFRIATISDIETIMLMEQANSKFVGQWSFEQHQLSLENQNVASIIFYDDTNDYNR